MNIERIAFAVACNDRAVLKRDFMASPDIAAGRYSAALESGMRSAAATYNALLKKLNTEFAVFAHQDVYFPAGWAELVLDQIDDLNNRGIEWLTLGCAGTGRDGKIAGHVWSSSINRLIGKNFESPVEAQSLDELVLIVNTGHGYKFDENLPGYHLYGTDIVQSGLKSGLKSFVINAPCIHNDKPKPILGRDYLEAYKYMQKKWRSELRIQTTVMPLDKTTFHYHLRNLKQKRLQWIKRLPASFNGNPRPLSVRLGFEKE
ncbi:MAG TPA: hypothetical protein VNB22_22850 [Pyrinomonadaceae bacterium]|nr:hypothetical protein [Pyrinomonadaceae bacterium]